MNQVILKGNLGDAPNFISEEGKNPLCTFSVATTERWKNDQGEPQERTEWHRCVAFGKTSELCREHLQKGSSVFLEGKSATRQWKDQEGNDRYTTEVVLSGFPDTLTNPGSKGINKIRIKGNLGADPEIRYTQDGNPVANFSVATTERWKDKDGNQQEKTEWHKCVAFGKIAEIVAEHLAKGSKIFLDGKHATRKWQDQGGKDRYTTEVVISSLDILSWPQTENSEGTN